MQGHLIILILVNCRDLALMAATLANNGVNPVTGIRAINEKFVPRIMSVMTSCGIYDYSGSWLFNIGMPAKSGVGGGVLAVLPGQIGLAVFSLKLDIHGNSVRGLVAFVKISGDFDFHILRVSAYLGCITAGMKVSIHHSEKGHY